MITITKIRDISLYFLLIFPLILSSPINPEVPHSICLQGVWYEPLTGTKLNLNGKKQQQITNQSKG